MISSPTYLSMVPSQSKMIPLRWSRYICTTSVTSLAAIDSDIDVNPRMSTNINVMSRRSPPRRMSLTPPRVLASSATISGFRYVPNRAVTLRFSRFSYRKRYAVTPEYVRAMASHGWNRSGTQLLKADRADIPSVKSTRAIAVPMRPHSTVTRATPTAVARLRTRINNSSAKGGSAVRNLDGASGDETALSSIWTTLAWISTPGMGSVWLAPKLVGTSCSSLTPVRL